MRSVGGQSAFPAHVATVRAYGQSWADISSVEPRCGCRADPPIEASQGAARYAPTFCDVPRVRETLLRDGKCCLTVTAPKQRRARSQVAGGEYLAERRRHDGRWWAALLRLGSAAEPPGPHPIGFPAAPRAGSGLFDVETRSTRRLPRARADRLSAPWWPKFRRRTGPKASRPCSKTSLRSRSRDSRPQKVAAGAGGGPPEGDPAASGSHRAARRRTACAACRQRLTAAKQQAEGSPRRTSSGAGGPAARRASATWRASREGTYTHLKFRAPAAVRRPAPPLAGSGSRTGASEDSATSM